MTFPSHEHERQLPRAARHGDELEVDKAWHRLHFLLTGTAWEGTFPHNFIVAGGEEVGDDLGYGPARALRSEDVRNIDAALEPITPNELGLRFDADRAADLSGRLDPRSGRRARVPDRVLR